MATLRATGSALLGTITTSANTVIRAVNMIDATIQYGDNYMRSVLEEQRKQIAIDSETSDERILASVTRAATERDLETQAFMSLSPDHERLYKANMERFSRVLERAKAG